MRTLIVMLLAFMTIGCGSDGGGDSSVAKQSSASGLYYMAGTHLSSGGFYYAGVNFLADNKILVMEMYNPNPESSSTVYMRKQEGVYTKSGNKYMVDWTYETCDPDGSKEYQIDWIDPSDRIFITIDSTTVQFLNAEKWGPKETGASTSFVMTEDIECNKFPQ